MISRRILAAIALLCAFSAPSYAQKTKAVLDAEISQNFPDNTTGAITPLLLRNTTQDIVNSVLPTAPVVSGNLSSFDGTTGLPKDSGITALSPSGSGAICLVTSCQMVTPNIGVATGTSLALGGASVGSNSFVTPVIISASNWVGVGVTPSSCGSASIEFSVCDTTNSVVRLNLGNSSSLAALTVAASGLNAIFAAAPSGAIILEVGPTTGVSLDASANATVPTTFGFNGQSAPTIASGACGATTNGVVTSGTNQAGLITIGAATTTTCTITFGGTLPRAPAACMITAQNLAAATVATTLARVSSISATQWVITGSALANAAYYYHCI